jgi:hypothetical protein
MAERIPSWTPLDERQLRQLQERKETRARMLSDRVEKVADDIIVHNMNSTELARALVENATAVSRVVHPFLTGPFTVLVFNTGASLPIDGRGMGLVLQAGTVKEWTHAGILEMLDADGWAPAEDLEAMSGLCDNQGEPLRFRETLRIEQNLATLLISADKGLTIVQVPFGMGEY